MLLVAVAVRVQDDDNMEPDYQEVQICIDFSQDVGSYLH